MKGCSGVFSLALCIGPCVILVGLTPALHAQPTPSFSVSYDLFPYQKFKDPTTELRDARILSNAVTIRASYPRVFSEGRTVLINEIYYQRREFSYESFPSGDPDICDIHDVNYTLTLRHGLSQKWAMLTIVTPGLASDFEAHPAGDDFSIQVVAVLIRQFNEKFSFGFGAAYSNQFGEPIPLPVLAFDWNNGDNLSWNTILPVSSEFWYQASDRLQLGLVLGSGGNKYHGDPDIFDVADPQLRYSVVTLGPSVGYRLADWLQLNVDSGFIGFHRFEFYDGDDELESFDMKPSAFFRAGLALGG